MTLLLRFISKVYNKRIPNISIKQYSTVPVGKINENTEFDQHINDLESLTTIFAKNRLKLPKREPFVKNLFLGKLDTEILAYPELSKKEHDELQITVNLLEKVTNEIEKPKDVKDALYRLKRLKCLGLQCPLEIGGRELNQTEYCRFNEILLKSHYRYTLLNNELCIYIISKYGTDDQKSKYLQKLLNGEIASTISIANNSHGCNNLDNLKADITQNFDSYVLNGRKNCILGGVDADLFIVFVQDENSSKSHSNENCLVFIIDRHSPGISIEKLEVNEPSLDGTINIIFNDAIVSKKNKINIEEFNKDILSDILTMHHLSIGVINLNIMKKLVDSLSEYLLINSPPGKEIYQTEAITSVVSEILSYTYVVESMVYMTSGLMSSYEGQDCDMESLITRIFSTELALKSTELGMSLVGTASMNQEHFCKQLHKEALSQYISYENANMLKMMIGLFGIQHTGKYIGDTVRKLRNPLFNGMFLMKKLWQSRSQENDNPNLILELKNYLHPSCQDAANEIEYCILRLQYATESLLSRYGIDALNRHNHLRRLSESAMYIYGMIACLSRASRSYCIGLENNDLEILMANVVCTKFYKLTKNLLNDVIEERSIMDDPLKILSDNLYKKKNYYFVHPLSKNF